MKICADCRFGSSAAVQVGPSQHAMMEICRHLECRNAVTGEPVPAMQARKEIVYCTFEARYFEPKQQPKEEITDNVIQLT